MNCYEIEAFVHQAVDNELSPAQAAEFENHVNNCPECKKLMQNVMEYKLQMKEVASQLPQPSSDLNDRLVSAIRSEGKRERRSKILSITSMAAAVIFMVIAVAYLSPQLTNKPDTVASIDLGTVIDHYHNHATMDKKKLMATKTRMAKKVMLDLADMSEQVGFKVQDQELSQFMLASSEVLKVGKDGRKVVRLCYKTSDLMSSTCIDVYQTEKGGIKLAGLTKETLDGKEVACGKVNGNSVVYFKGAKSDLVFVSVLPEEKLKELVVSSSKNLS